MPFSLGNSNISKIYVGTKEVQRIYLGSTVVYQKQPWTPADIQTLAWYDAADAATITLNGSTVSQWDDKSGNDNHVLQVSASLQPTYNSTSLNGKGGINFFPHKGLADPSKDLAAAFVICVPIASSATWYSAHCHFESCDYPQRIGGFRRNNNTGFYPDPFPAAIWEDGVTKTPSDGGFNTIDSPHLIAYTRNAGVSPPTGGIAIGNFFYYNLGTHGGSGREHETIVLSTLPSEADRQKLEGYLAHKWGLTANLPIDHPYKSSVP